MTSSRDAREGLMHRRRYSLPGWETTSVLRYILSSSICVKKWVKVLLSYYSIHAVKEDGRCAAIALLILNLGNMLRVEKFKLRPLCPRKKTTGPIEKDAVWAPEAVWTFHRRKIVCLCRDSSPGPCSP